MAEDSPAQYGFLRQISADTALKSFAMRQHYSPFCLVSTKICSLKTASHLKDLFFCAVWCFFVETILTYGETKSAAMCGKTSPSGILRRTFFSLPRSCIWIPRVGKKTLKRAKLFSISSINKDYISYETLILIGFVKYSLFLFVLLFGLR